MSNRDDLLPSNSTSYERAQSETSARLLDVDTDVIRRARDPLHCPIELLPMLAWERSVDRWDGLSEAERRAEIAGSFDRHARKGTPAAIEAEIQRDTGASVRVQQWFEYGGAFPRFRVLVAQPRGPWTFPVGVRASALRRKNVRDVLDGVVAVAREEGTVFVGAALAVGRRIVIYPQASGPQIIDGAAYVGAALGVIRKITIQPL